MKHLISISYVLVILRKNSVFSDLFVNNYGEPPDHDVV
jgi:hypothetical protein